MDQVRIPHKGLVLICDGAKALLFENRGDAQALNLKAVEVQLESHPPTRALGTDRPGRAHESLGEHRSAQAAPDWHEIAETEFLERLAEHIDALAQTEAKFLALVAPPRALGVIRHTLTPRARDLVTAEIGKDWTKLPTPEIERSLAAMGELK